VEGGLPAPGNGGQRRRGARGQQRQRQVDEGHVVLHQHRKVLGWEGDQGEDGQRREDDEGQVSLGMPVPPAPIRLEEPLHRASLLTAATHAGS